MHIEHLALQVDDPRAMAVWYVAHLGMRIVRAAQDPTHTHFLADAGGRVMLEIYRNDRVPVPDYRALDPLHLHIAFAATDIAGTRERLLAAGATSEGEATTTPVGDTLAMLRDPWGLPIQLAHRATSMLP
jgi:glyoxylase I family protein